MYTNGSGRTALFQEFPITVLTLSLHTTCPGACFSSRLLSILPSAEPFPTNAYHYQTGSPMSENINQMEQASRLASAQQPAIDDAGDAMAGLRIYPVGGWTVHPLTENLGTYHAFFYRKMSSGLEYLSHLRIDRTRIKPIESPKGRRRNCHWNPNIDPTTLGQTFPDRPRRPPSHHDVAHHQEHEDDGVRDRTEE